MRLSVGSAPSNWGEEKLRSFYRELAASPVDMVYVGETICPDRSCFSPGFLKEICDDLTRAGKEVYASSLILVKDQKQYRAFADLVQQVKRAEINSPAFLALARRYPAAGGMFLNVYNSAAARVLARNMIERIVLPCELGLEAISTIAKRSPVAVEVVVHGHIPIATSITCTTARCLNVDDDNCEKVCRRYPEGMTLRAGDLPMFRIDGPQTLSAATFCLVEYLPELQQAGVDTVRILPQGNHTVRVAHIYRDVLDDSRKTRDALEELSALSNTGLCNGWFHGKAGWVYESRN